MSWQEQLQDYVEFLKQKYDLTDSQLQDELFSEKIPAGAFNSELTPLQVIAGYLRDVHGKTVKDIAGTLGRTSTETEKFLEAVPHEHTYAHSGPKIAVRVFHDRTLSASEHLVDQLQQRGMTNSEIAAILGKSERTIWTLHYRIEKKRGRS